MWLNKQVVYSLGPSENVSHCVVVLCPYTFSDTHWVCIGANVNHKDSDGATALMAASPKGRLAIATLLINAGRMHCCTGTRYVQYRLCCKVLTTTLSVHFE